MRDKPEGDPRSADEREDFDGKAVAAVSGAHLIHDSYPAFIGVLLPLLIPKLGLTLAMAGLLASAIRWTSLLQPVFGYLGDRFDTRYWIVAAPVVTAVCMSLVGLASHALIVLALLLMTGVSHAVFHPAAGSMVTWLSGQRWGKGMSYFMTGGELGRALGPLFIAGTVALVGLTFSWLAMVPGLVAAAILYRWVRQAPRIGMRGAPAGISRAVRRKRGAVGLLAAAVGLRSLVTAGFLTFYPTHVIQQGGDLLLAGMAVAVYELAGTAGAFLGGSTSDRTGRRLVLAGSLIVGVPVLCLGLLLAPGPTQVSIIAVAGFLLLSAMPVQLAFMQELLPRNRSAAVGLTYFMITGGAIAATVAVGILATLFGLQTALIAAGLAALAALPLVYLLPEPRRPRRRVTTINEPTV